MNKFGAIVRGGGSGAGLEAFPHPAGIESRDGRFSCCRHARLLRNGSSKGGHNHDYCKNELHRDVRHRESSMMKFTRTPNACEADLGAQSADTSAFIFRKRWGNAPATKLPFLGELLD
jgi:hypothetical protein